MTMMEEAIEHAGMANQPEQNLSSNRGHNYRQWAGSRDKIFSPSGRGRGSFLTSLFIELTTPWPPLPAWKRVRPQTVVWGKVTNYWSPTLKSQS